MTGEESAKIMREQGEAELRRQLTELGYEPEAINFAVLGSWIINWGKRYYAEGGE